MDDSQGGLVLMATTAIITIALLVTVVAVMIVSMKGKERHERDLLTKQLEVQREVMQNISWELHDNLAQVASLIKMQLNTLPLDDRDQATRKLEDTKELTRKLLHGLKSLSLSNNTDMVIHLGIVKSLENEITRLNSFGTFESTLTVEGPSPRFEVKTTFALYRMSQEIINNIIKHSGGRRVDVSLRTSEKSFTMTFQDDGVGFDPTVNDNTNSSGLFNLRNRAKTIQAKFHVDSSPGSGAKITVELPL
jgi:signal transduction histidine kinase